MESDWHLGRTNEQLQRADGLSWRNATTRKSWRVRKAYPGIRDRPQITQTEDHSKGTGTVRRATGGPKTRSRTCTVPCVLWTDPRLPGMLGNRTRVSPHSGLQSKTARMARPTRIGNIRTGTIVSRVPTLATGQADSQVLGRYT